MLALVVVNAGEAAEAGFDGGPVVSVLSAFVSCERAAGGVVCGGVWRLCGAAPTGKSKSNVRIETGMAVTELTPLCAFNGLVSIHLHDRLQFKSEQGLADPGSVHVHNQAVLNVLPIRH